MKKIKLQIKKYRLNIGNAEEKTEYNNLKNKLEKQGLKLFASIDMNGFKSRKFWEGLQESHNYEIDTSYIFDNQYNTKCGLRIFDWSEDIQIHNEDIKKGYYIVLSDAFNRLKELTKTTLKCGYCGKLYPKQPVSKWCKSCRDSEYLEPNNYPLLYLHPVSMQWEEKETQEIPFDVLESIKSQQQKGLERRLKNRIKQEREDLKKKANDVKKEKIAFEYLVKKGIDFKNVIYYNHSNIFCFGWSTPLKEEEIKHLEKHLADFPFEYKLKTEETETA